MRSVVLVHVLFAVAREGSGIVMSSQPMEYIDQSAILVGKE
jgi:hypothetical protein